MSDALLTSATIKFHTNNEDKDSDTHVTIDVNTQNDANAAHLDNDFGHFDDHSDNGPYNLVVNGGFTKSTLQSGYVLIRIDPNGHDTWRFNFALDLVFSDQSHMYSDDSNLELTQDRREQTFGLRNG
jgi:hypothetical protein